MGAHDLHELVGLGHGKELIRRPTPHAVRLPHDAPASRRLGGRARRKQAGGGAPEAHAGGPAVCVFILDGYGYDYYIIMQTIR